jgi:iron complex outermembrane recepter protein
MAAKSPHITCVEAPDTATFAAGKVIRRQVTSFLSVTPFANESRGGEIMSQRLIVSAIQGVLLSFSFSVLAEDVPTVVVSATRSEQSAVTVPATIKIISQQDIKNSGATNVAEILRGQAGVQVSDLYGDGTDTSVSMRGLDSTSNVLIVVDGRRLNNVDISSPNLGSISIQDIERIEIIQGSAGTLFGDQAVGGVINIITRPSQKNISTTLSAGSYGRKRVQVSAGDKITENLSYRLSGDVLRADNYRDNSSVNDKNAFARMDYLAGEGSYFVEYQIVDTLHELPGSLLAGEVAQNRRQSVIDFIDDYSDTSVNVVRAGMQQGIGQNWSLEMELTSRDEDLSIQQSFRGFSITTPLSIDNNQRELTPRMIGTYDSSFGEMIVTLGADMIDTQYNSQITSIKDDQNLKAVYAQVIYPFMQQWSVTAGARYSEVNNDVTATYKNGEVKEDVTVGELGLSWQPGDTMKIFARVDQNFRFAKVDELTYTSPGIELKTQTGNSSELGMQWNQASYRASLTAYKLSLKDEIAFDPSVPEPVGSFFGPGANVNFDPTTHEGLILDSSYSVTSNMSVVTNFTYTEARFDSGVYANKHIPGISPRTLTIAPEFNNGNGFVSRMEFAYNDSAYVDGDNDNVLNKKEAYTLVNAGISAKQSGWSLSLRINNLLNRTYNESQNSWGSIIPANEINFWLALSVDIE